jgi:enoyl-CoA hydratase/carnithine racemase
MKSKGVNITRKGDVTRVCLSRPEKRNALDATAVEVMLQTVEAAASDGTRLLVFCGEGENFSAGFDMSDADVAGDGELLLRFVRMEQLLQSIFHAPFETLALAHGRNFGAGVDLVRACSRGYAALGTTFRMPGLKFGVVLGTRRLCHRIGADAARSLLLESATFDVETVCALRFIHGIAARDAWQGPVERTAAAARNLSEEADGALRNATTPETRNEDLADLVRSAARPGLSGRLREYRNRQ